MLERLKLLEDNVKELLEFKKKFSLDDVLTDKSREWALRYGFLETIQIVIDVACHVVSKYNLGNPLMYSECVDILKDYKYIDESLAVKLNGMIGLRNILVHEYITIEREKLYGLLDQVGDFREFVGRIKEFV
jgi:uncharacterized protein YutE (UPF0331/DUF86 family)